MLSLTKLALVAAVALAVIAFTRNMRAHKARAAARRARPEVAELVRCPACGVHHAAGDGHVCEGPTGRKS